MSGAAAELDGRALGSLADAEYFWRDRQPWLLAHGYKLRPRYSPDWKPSWEGTNRSFRSAEDGWMMDHPAVLDATRISDGTLVTLKTLSKSLHPYEVEIGQFFSREPHASDPRNHCVPIYDVLQDPQEEDTVFLVMPLLRDSQDPPFDTIGEVLDYIEQITEGLQFMHSQHVAHRDCMRLNIMMDPRPLYPEPYHPVAIRKKMDLSGNAQHFTRTEHPTKYFLVDFGLSRKYRAEDMPPKESPILGGDKTAPEHQGDKYDEPCDPFPTDVYYWGNMLRQTLLKEYIGLDFLQEFVDEMVQEDPQKRPTIDEVAVRFKEVKQKVTSWKARSRLVHRRENPLVGVFRGVRHVFRTGSYIVRRLPPVPSTR